MIDEGATRISGHRGEYVVDFRQPFQQGGQGELYEARSATGSDVVVKLYRDGKATSALRDGIDALTREQSPGAGFLWPFDVVSYGGRFGYVMDKAPEGYVPLRSVLADDVSLGFAAAIDVALHIVEGFRRLHARGYHYCDISDGNVLLDPTTGRVLICDNDNVGTTRRPATIQGTPGFMAPEVGRRVVPPSAGSDRYSLGVLLFMLLVGEHPLEGRREAECELKTPDDFEAMYCTEPVFVFDPEDDSNRPVPGWQDNALLRWPILPSVLRDVFTRLFTVGLRAPARRPSFGEWTVALVGARGLLVACETCSAEVFAPARTDPQERRCWSCGADTGRYGRLVIQTRAGFEFELVLDAGRIFSMVHITARLESDLKVDEVVGAVIENPQVRGMWGVKNVSSADWRVTFPGGEVRTIGPGRSVPLRDGVRIDLGSAEGTIVFDDPDEPAS